MSWSIKHTGTVAGVRERVLAARAWPESGDQTQIESAKAFILAELDGLAAMAMSATPGMGVQVEASGHDDSASRHVNIAVSAILLALDPAQRA